MIPRAHITAWRAHAPWSTDAQVEQDLVISRAIVEVFSDPLLAGNLAFRGGTALHKLYLAPPARYSEDIDLVQVKSGPIGEIMTALRQHLDSWLGAPRRKQSEGRMTVIYRFDSEIPPITPLRLKVEVNTREHFSVCGFARQHFDVNSPWFCGSTELLTYALEELLATKLRALYQRSKGRDLYDLAAALLRFPNLDAARVVDCFERYLAHEGHRVSRAEFEANMHGKMQNPAFHGDIEPLLVPATFQPDASGTHAAEMGATSYDRDAAYRRVHEALIMRLPSILMKTDRSNSRRMRVARVADQPGASLRHFSRNAVWQAPKARIAATHFGRSRRQLQVAPPISSPHTGSDLSNLLKYSPESGAPVETSRPGFTRSSNGTGRHCPAHSALPPCCPPVPSQPGAFQRFEPTPENAA